MLNNNENIKFSYINKYLLNNTQQSRQSKFTVDNNVEGGSVYRSGPIVNLLCASVDQ